MANKALRPCAKVGCTALVHGGGYCDKHKPAEPPKDRRQYADAKWHTWYNRKPWLTISKEQLIEHPYCAECERRGIRTKATEVDHIRPHRGSWTMFMDRSNLQSLCHWCHSRKTAAEVNQRKEERDAGAGKKG